MKAVLLNVFLVNVFFNLFAQNNINYTYDNLNRLKTANISNGNQIQYTYDELGNRMTKTVSIEPITLNAPKTNAGSVSSCPGGSISIPVTVSDFNQITAVSLRMDYNPVLMSYSSYSNLNSAFAGAIINHVQVNESLSKVIFVWINVNPQSLANGSKLFDLNFNLIQGTPVVAFNNASNGGSDCEYADANGNPLNDMPTIAYYVKATVNNLGAGNAGDITGTSSVYSGQQGVAYSVLLIPNATSYLWNYTGTGVMINNGSTNSITIDFTTNSTSGDLTVMGTSSCGNGLISKNFPIVVNPLPATHTITIPEGWSGLSSWTIPLNDAIEEIFFPIEDQITILQTLYGFYFPSQNINTIGDWESQSAFKIKATVSCTLGIAGFEDQNKNLALATGWNLIPVVCNVPVDVVQLFSTVSNDLKIAKDVAGSGVYWPEFGINSIGSLMPGKAYFVKMNNAGTITFPQNDFSGLKESSPQIEPEEPSPWGWGYKTPSSHLFAIPANITNQFGDNSFIGAFTTEGVCAGSCSVKIGQSTILVSNQDDPLTQEKEGFVDGEPLSFRIWDSEAGKDYLLQVEYDMNQPDHSGVFASNGISAIRKMEMFTNIQEHTLNSIRIFPNPGKKTISILIDDLDFEKGVLTIYTIDGRFVKTENIDVHHTNINISEMRPGAYLLKIEYRNKTINKRLLKK